MSDLPHDSGLSDIPEALPEPKKRFNLQLVWLIPIVAAIIGGTLAVRTYLNKGPVITIAFKTGEGLEAGKTKIKYKDVEIGHVTDVTIAKDLKGVIATAELKKGVTPYLVEDTKFWVVRAQISGGSVTGLGTLMGGSYIGMDVGTSKQEKRDFKGLETAPVVSMDMPGSRFLLHSPDLGSLDTGSPIYYRRIQVGQILSYELDGDGKGVTFKVFIQAPYDKYVKTSSRFWHASGIDLSMDASGLKLNTQSLVSIMLGGIAFQTLDEQAPAPPLEPNAAFTLFASRDEAMKNRDTISNSYLMIFKESVRGLAVGAPVDFRGLIIGEVTAINLEFDQQQQGDQHAGRCADLSGADALAGCRCHLEEPPETKLLYRADGRGGAAGTDQERQHADRAADGRPGLLPQGPQGQNQLGQQSTTVPHHPQQPG